MYNFVLHCINYFKFFNERKRENDRPIFQEGFNQCTPPTVLLLLLPYLSPCLTVGVQYFFVLIYLLIYYVSKYGMLKGENNNE